MSEKKSQFIEVETLTDSQLIPVFGSGVDRKISKPNLFKQIKDESFSPFIYPTIAILQSADLEVDVDNPTYCRCEETEYRLYKITNAAPGVDDITLTNGNTAEHQIEYRDTGFVTSVATAATGALAVFTDSTGQEIDKSVVPTNAGKAFIQATDGASISFPRKNADNTVTMRGASQYFDDIKQSATHGAAGVIKTADGTSTLAQTATDEAITPANLATLKASNAETLTGTDDTKYITPENLQHKLESDGVLIIENVAALASTPVVAGTVYYLKEYHAGTGYGGGDLVGVAGSTTYDNGETFAGSGGYFRRINYKNLTVEDFGFYPAAVDNSAALAAVFAYDKYVEIPERTYKINTTVTTDKNPNLKGFGDRSILDLSGGGKIEIKKSIVAIPDLSANAVGGENVLIFSSAHGLSVNDIVIIYNPTDYSFSPKRAYYRDGVMLKVASISSAAQVKVYGIIPSTFIAANVDCYKLTGAAVKLRDFAIVPNSAQDVQVEIDGHINVLIDNVYCPNGSNDANISIARSWGIEIDAKGSASAGGAYPVTIANCQHGKLTGDTNSTRHCVLFGGYGDAGSVPTRDFVISNMILENEPTAGIGASDAHGNCENLLFANCVMKSGANIGGKNIYYDNCVIYGRPPSLYADGNCVYGSEFVGGNIEFSKCNFVSWGSLASFGLIYFNMSVLTDNVIFKITDCTFDSKAATVSDNIVIIFIGDSSPSAFRIDTQINGFWIRTPNLPTSVFAWVGSNDKSSTMSLLMDNIRANNGCSLVAASNAANYNSSLRLPRSINTVTVSIDNTTFQHIGAAQSYRYVYPRLPRVIVSAGTKNSDGSAQSGSIGGKTVVPFARAISASQITMAVTSGDGANFTSSDTVTLTSIAEINEL